MDNCQFGTVDVTDHRRYQNLSYHLSLVFYSVFIFAVSCTFFCKR